MKTAVTGSGVDRRIACSCSSGLWKLSPERPATELTRTYAHHSRALDLLIADIVSDDRPLEHSLFVDAMLADGSRLHVVIPDITREHWAVNIRKFVVKADQLDDLVGSAR